MVFNCLVSSTHAIAFSATGTVNLITGITNSCDIVFYEIWQASYNNDHPEGECRRSGALTARFLVLTSRRHLAAFLMRSEGTLYQLA